MITVQEADKYTAIALSPQHEEYGISYVESPYLIKDGNLWYNALTDEAVIVESPEKEKQDLIRRWFYIPEDFDCKGVCHVIRQKKMTIQNGPGSTRKNNYIIFTTTSCNASCGYCFERGIPAVTMSEEVAKGVASYILRTHTEQAFKIKWFGGEPLLNRKVITIISDILNQNGVNYWSEIVTNAYLLPKCSDEDLRSWKVKSIQITVDGVGEDYERIKGLPKGAYDSLKESLARLTRLNIRVPLRIHYDPEKGIEGCYKIVNDLSEYKAARFYARIIYGTEKKEHYDELLKLEDYITSIGNRSFDLPPFSLIAHCMADAPGAACITPEGKLTPCEHYPHASIYGSVFTDRKDLAVLRPWSERRKYKKADCIKCVLYPRCRMLTKCEVEDECSNGMVYYQVETIKRKVRMKANALQLHRSADEERT